MSRFKILYLHETSRLAGAENSLLNLITKMDRTRFIPLFICPDKGPFVDELTKLGARVTLIEFARLKSLWGIYPTLRKIRRLIQKENINLIHSNSPRTNFYAAMAGKLEKIPVVWHERCLITNELIDPDSVFLFLPDRIVCNSKAIANRFIKKGKLLQKVVVILNGVDIEKFSPKLSGEKIKKEFKLRSELPTIGIISRFGPDKGHEYFIQAAARIVKKFSKVNFLIVGDAVFEEDRWREEYLKKMVKELNLDNCVNFTGFRRDIPELLAALDIMVLASDAEPCGRVLFEAMAMQKPVVATNTGGTPEIVKDKVSGILIPPKNSEAMAEAIIKLLQDKEMALRMGKVGRKRAEQFFSIEENVRKTEKVYKSLLNLKGS